MAINVKDASGATVSTKTMSDALKTIDAPAGGAPEGVPAALIRRDNAAQSLVSADGDFVVPSADQRGRTRVTAESPILRSVSVAIGSGASLSAEATLNGARVVGILMDASWTAAAISFDAAPAPGGTFGPVYDGDGNEISLTVAAGRYIVILPGDLYGIGALKVRSGLAGAPVNQAGARSLTLILAD